MKRTISLMAVLVLGASLAWGASSRSNRDDSLLYVGVAPLGVHLPTLATQPVAVGVYLGENWLVGAEYGSADLTVKDGKGEFGPAEFTVPDTEDDWKLDGSYDNLGAFVRWFPGTNSFNITLAAHKREWTADLDFVYTRSDTGTPVPLSAGLTADSTVGTLGLGNQWMMDFGLVIGVDWVVASAPLGTSTSSRIDDSSLAAYGGLPAAEKRQAEQEIEDAADTLNTVSALPGLFVLSLGWAF